MVAEIDLVYLEKYLPAPYDPDYDPLRLPRHVASPLAIDFLVEQAEKFPAASTCDLGDVPDVLFDDPEGLAEFIAGAAAEFGCPDGVYVTSGLLVRVSGGQGEVITLEP